MVLLTWKKIIFASVIFPLYQMKNNKVLVCELFNILPLHGPCLYDVIDADCWAQSGSTCSCFFVTFKHQFSTNQMRGVKKNCWVPIFILSLMILGFGFPLSSFPLLWRLGSSLDKKTIWTLRVYEKKSYHSTESHSTQETSLCNTQDLSVTLKMISGH